MESGKRDTKPRAPRAVKPMKTSAATALRYTLVRAARSPMVVPQRQDRRLRSECYHLLPASPPLPPTIIVFTIPGALRSVVRYVQGPFRLLCWQGLRTSIPPLSVQD
jgi:hypothetical protein